MQLQELGGLLELPVFALAALGLELAELLQCFFNLTREALLENADIGECLGVVAIAAGHGYSGVCFRMFDDEFSLGLEEPEREEVRLDGAGAVQTPSTIGEGLNELLFGIPLGFRSSKKRLVKA